MRQVFLAALIVLSPSPSFSIINGLPADVEDFRSFVSIRTTSPFPRHEGREINGCGGTLVASEWVLTALHCKSLFENAAHATEPVFVGVNIQPDGSFGARLRITEVHMAPVLFGRARLDAALLRLEADATTHGAEVAAIFAGEPVVGLPTTTIGIGMGFEGAVLEYYNSEVAEAGLCATEGSDLDPAHDFCVGLTGSTQRTGYGDSGGPLFVADPENPAAYRLAGIVKGGVKATPSGPDETEFIRYADVTQLRDWIRAIVDAAE